MPAKKPARKAQVKVKDMKAKKNPKGGFSWGKPAGKKVKIDF